MSRQQNPVKQIPVTCLLLLQPCPQVSDFFYFLLFGDLHLGTALNLSVLVGGHTSVMAGVRLGYLFDLQFGILAPLFDGDTTTGGDLPPFAFHPFHAGDWVASNLCDEGGSALCEETGDM